MNLIQLLILLASLSHPRWDDHLWDRVVRCKNITHAPLLSAVSRRFVVSRLDDDRSM